MLNGTCSSCGRSSRQQLMDTINQSSFAVNEMVLYLDTHPDDQEAMAYFQKQSCIRREAMKQYAQQYGPLTVDSIDDTCNDTWEWMQQPWPWEINRKGRC